MSFELLWNSLNHLLQTPSTNGEINLNEEDLLEILKQLVTFQQEIEEKQVRATQEIQKYILLYEKSKESYRKMEMLYNKAVKRGEIRDKEIAQKERRHDEQMEKIYLKIAQVLKENRQIKQKYQRQKSKLIQSLLCKEGLKLQNQNCVSNLEGLQSKQNQNLQTFDSEIQIGHQSNKSDQKWKDIRPTIDNFVERQQKMLQNVITDLKQIIYKYTQAFVKKKLGWKKIRYLLFTKKQLYQKISQKQKKKHPLSRAFCQLYFQIDAFFKHYITQTEEDNTPLSLQHIVEVIEEEKDKLQKIIHQEVSSEFFHFQSQVMPYKNPNEFQNL